jgi:hypothetical protein
VLVLGPGRLTMPDKYAGLADLGCGHVHLIASSHWSRCICHSQGPVRQRSITSAAPRLRHPDPDVRRHCRRQRQHAANG